MKDGILTKGHPRSVWMIFVERASSRESCSPLKRDIMKMFKNSFHSIWHVVYH